MPPDARAVLACHDAAGVPVVLKRPALAQEFGQDDHLVGPGPGRDILSEADRQGGLDDDRRLTLDAPGKAVLGARFVGVATISNSAPIQGVSGSVVAVRSSGFLGRHTPSWCGRRGIGSCSASRSGGHQCRWGRGRSAAPSAPRPTGPHGQARPAQSCASSRQAPFLAESDLRRMPAFFRAGARARKGKERQGQPRPAGASPKRYCTCIRHVSPGRRMLWGKPLRLTLSGQPCASSAKPAWGP